MFPPLVSPWSALLCSAALAAHTDYGCQLVGESSVLRDVGLQERITLQSRFRSSPLFPSPSARTAPSSRQAGKAGEQAYMQHQLVLVLLLLFVHLDTLIRQTLFLIVICAIVLSLLVRRLHLLSLSTFVLVVPVSISVIQQR